MFAVVLRTGVFIRPLQESLLSRSLYGEAEASNARRQILRIGLHREYADRYLMYQLNHQLLTACSAKDIMLFISKVVPSSRMALPVKVPNIW